MANKDTIVEKEIRHSDSITRYDDGTDQLPIDSQRQEAQHERRTLIRKREEVIKEQELAVAEKDRAIERKRALLKQQAQAQRMKEQADLEVQEILERERMLQERLNRMK